MLCAAYAGSSGGGVSGGSGIVASWLGGGLSATVAMASGGVLLMDRLRARPGVAASEGVRDMRACLFMAARVAVPDVLREPGDRWMR